MGRKYQRRMIGSMGWAAIMWAILALAAMALGGLLAFGTEIADRIQL